MFKSIFLSFFACGWMEPALPDLVSDPQHVGVEASTTATNRPLASDLVAHPEGGFWLLDGYRQALVRYDDAGTPLSTLVLPAPAVRFAPTADGSGWWITDPAAGAIHRLNTLGESTHAFTVALSEGVTASPTAVLDLGASLLVGTRTGELLWIGADGAVKHRIDTDPDGHRLGSIADFTRLPDGRVAVVDALGPNVLMLSAAPDPAKSELRPWAALRGPWVGHLLKPKAATAGPDGTLLVVDSQQGAVQLFDHDGTALGVLATGGQILDVGHAIALDGSGGRVRVLDQRTGIVFAFQIQSAELARARERAKVRHLRTVLVSAPAADHVSDARLCFQCHDGIVNDEREVWDETLGHHPVGVLPEGVKPPEGFPLDEQGRMRCGTCHSPHGGSSVEELAAAAEGADLARHRTGTEDLFLRAKRSDSALCIACHTNTAHEQVAANSHFPNAGAHPIGDALVAALAKRGGPVGALGLPAGVSGNCLDCHAVHAAGNTSLQASLGDGLACIGCHPDRAGERHHPLPTRPVRSAADHGAPGTACFACHDLVGGAKPSLLRDERALCSTCHTQPKLEAGHTRIQHASGASCLACHAPHAAAGPDLRTASLVATSADPTGCTSCHKPDPAGVRGPGFAGHPVGGEAPTCAECHAAPHNPVAVASCGGCHEPQQAEADRGGHGRLACAACHVPHESNPTYARAKAENPASARCLACHAPGAPGSIAEITAWNHPIPVFEANEPRWAALKALTLFDALGQPVAPGANGALTCQTCHTVHGPPELGGELRKAGWEAPCAACHGDDALPMYRWFHQPERRARMLGGTP